MKDLLCWILVLCLAGCAPLGRAEPDCDEIKMLRGLVGKEMSAEMLQTWVNETYQLPLNEITVKTWADGQTRTVRWKQHGTSYLAGLAQLRINSITLGDIRTPANRVLTCLGQPAQYSAGYSKGVEMNELHLALLYPDQGLLVYGYKPLHPWIRQPPRIDGRFLMLGFSFQQPGTAEQVMYQIYGERQPGVYEEVLRGYRPWPGSWKGIAVDIDPSLQP